MEQKLNIGIIGATGYVGQQFIRLLDAHPWFNVAKIAASGASAGKPYNEAVKGRWKMPCAIPDYANNLSVCDLNKLSAFCDGLDFVFCAVNMPKNDIRALEENIAKLEVPVVSNNSACRTVKDVPVIVPEINPEHSAVIEQQKQRLCTKRGFIAAKPNCSIQSYIPAITPLLKYKPAKIAVCTYQAISGSGRLLSEAPEIINNVIPLPDEEIKSETEPLKIWGSVSNDGIIPASTPAISAQCYRVCVENGHTAAVFVSFEQPPALEDILNDWANFETKPQKLGLPSAPKPFLLYMPEQDRPQPVLDADYENGMGITLSRLRNDNIFDCKFTCLSHNTIRGAAGGAVLTAELLVKQGYI